MAGFKDHPIKVTIREKWCKPIIKHLNEKLGYKLIYFGLPGIECYDVKCWLEYINYVIAVDCGDYNEEWDHDKATKEIQQLNKILNGLERSNLISGYSLYLGFMEEVVLQQQDKNGKPFKLSETVHIFNLDFCNSLTVPHKVIENGKVIKYYKSQVIEKLLEMQRALVLAHSSKFLMFVTIHTNFWEDEAEKYFAETDDEIFEKLKKHLHGVTKKERIVRLLRYYFIEIVKKHFISFEFIPVFFPTILYKGHGASKLLCFTITGTFSTAGIEPEYQDTEMLANSKFISANKDEIVIVENDYDNVNVHIDPVSIFKEFPSCKTLW